MLYTICSLTSSAHCISKEDRKCLATAMRASLGHLANQSIVQPEISPGNLSALFLNFSPTYRQLG